MAIRTYFWHDAVIGKFNLAMRKIVAPKHTSNFFNIGNAGDLMAKILIESIYNESAFYDHKQGKRLLCIGSVAHKIQHGDIICGIGAKSENIPNANAVNCLVYGLRGPVSYDIFKKAGHNVDDVKFLADPGLLLKRIMPQTNICTIKGKVIFIPHYKERFLFKKLINNYIEVVDIDADPITLGKEILSAECVLSSSLHGIVFSHALGRPCKFVLPQTNEPLLKFTDYFESINIFEPDPLRSVYDFKPNSGLKLPADIAMLADSIKFPDLEFLKTHGIAQS